MNLMNRLKKFFYLIVITTGFCVITSAVAGSFEDFFIAIRNDNTAILGDLLRRGFDPNTRNEKGQTGLTIAMQEQSPRAARMLLDQPGIDADAPNGDGETPLMMAALKGDMDGVKMLLARGAKVNRPGWSPLHYAAAGPEPAIVKLFLDLGAEVEALSPRGTTPLMLAAQTGAEDNVKLLLARGADPNRRDPRELAAADFAERGGRDWLAAQLRKLQKR
jgi:ankyrin repeat protein